MMKRIIASITSFLVHLPLWTVSLVVLCLIGRPSQLTAQVLGSVPPLPPITVSRAGDGLMAKIGDESLQVSVCRDSVIHVVASPKSLDSIRHHDQPWMLDRRQSC